MREDKFTVKTQEALRTAINEAVDRGHQEVGQEHLLYVLLGDGSGICSEILKKIGKSR